jgi:photosystem II stability/assembly factor-like uncharacterized protein
LAAVVANGYIYTSTDSGVTWTEQTSAGSKNWKSIASSADGTRLVATAEDDFIYRSLNTGVTWVKAAGIPQAIWSIVTSSNTGEHVYTGGFETNIWSYHNSMPQAQNVKILEQ